MKIIKYEDLSKIQKDLLKAAKETMENAYNPYSHFYVGAAVLASSGSIITGANIENSAYGSSICAERAALCRANSMGIRSIKSIAIIARTDKEPKSDDFTAPCGSCRQMLYEASQLSGFDLEIILSNTGMTKIGITGINELLPYAFGPKELGINLEKWK